MIKKNKTLTFYKYILTLILFLNVVEAAEPKENESLILPMPNGLSMEFMPVCVNTDSGLFDWKKIKLGDPSGGFKEYPTTMALGGSFPIEKDGQKQWCYYMGKYELSRKQYASLMTLKKPLVQSEKVYPETDVSWFDALEFANKYNQWLFAHAKDKLPKFDTSYGFVRLPTEAEWEFAARGGSAVTADVFDQKTPYDSSEIQKYEWFGGATSSHYKLQPVGVLKPNPLGLHDMLGNADEMTMSLFSVEYYQGRTGGFVIKGNNYMTAKNKLRSSFRTEQPFYRSDKNGIFKPHTKKTLGFRLVISALVFPSRKIQKEMSDEWEGYRSKLGANMPAALSTSATSVQVTAGSEDAFSYLDRLKNRLKQRGIDDNEIENSLGHLDSAIRDIATIRLKAEEDSAYLWIKVADEQALFIRRETKKLPLLVSLIEMQKRVKNMEKLAKYQARKQEHMTSIKNALSSYSDSIRQINTLSSESVKKAFPKYLNFLLQHNNAEQVQLLNRIRKHFDEYQKNKRVNLKKWEKDLLFR
ncbi:SUMF1/EgtB/PvdO family nonheme iron enzyme [Sulfurovum sp.]|uniref:formylglycine-generating enzyme family protein n=1 Tax=Sulfurovum sp. TaxID=1969726 RepID=UPI0025EC12C0|nr:SUMF1/EgtB/PvdO family nonheme iron enzyme [Sulfurovum sp.]